MIEHTKAKAWAAKHNLNAAQLSDLTGYSIEAIYSFWRGRTPNGRSADGKIQPWVWQRFKMACAGVSLELDAKQKFKWEN